MSTGYVVVQWNRQKRIYDAVLAIGVAGFVVGFMAVGKLVFRGDHAASDPILLMRACGVCAFVMLNVALCIGPLARLDKRFLPLLYNRRHLGVATCAVGCVHALLAVGFYHGFGVRNPLVSLLTSSTRFTSLSGFPFETLGIGALLILVLMASTSHDFWLKNLGQRYWKSMHMLVYAAYGLLVMHVALGALQAQRSRWLALLLGGGIVLVAGLHLLSGRRETRRDSRSAASLDAGAGGWVDAGSVDNILEARARIVCLPQGERVAVFRHRGCIHAITNVCAHQGGPLGEGKIVDGCVTCPWHGWQYKPDNGQSPPPFQERIATYRVRVNGRTIQIDPHALPPGTATDPGQIEELDHVTA